MTLQSIRESLVITLMLAAPVALISGIIHTAQHNSPGIILGFAAAMILAMLANFVAE